MFKFSLQTALDVRARQEKMKMKELAEKLAVERNILFAIDQIYDDLSVADKNMNSAKNEQFISIVNMKSLSHFKGRMKILMAKKNNELEEARKEVHIKQQALIQASKAKKTLEILREKEEKRYLENLAKIESKYADEIAGVQFVKNQANPRI